HPTLVSEGVKKALKGLDAGVPAAPQLNGVQADAAQAAGPPPVEGADVDPPAVPGGEDVGDDVEVGDDRLRGNVDGHRSPLRGFGDLCRAENNDARGDCQLLMSF